MPNDAQKTLRTRFSECKTSTLIDLLGWRADRDAGRMAYRFLADGETEGHRVSFIELDSQAKAIAALLQSFEEKGARVLLLYPPGLDYIAAFLGCLYAGMIAVPAYPPRINASMSRLQGIVADADATVALTTSAIISRLGPLLISYPELKPLRWLATVNLEPGLSDAWRRPSVDGNTIALLQYTSGSTAAPKGVMVSHGNLLHNETIIQRAFNQSRDSVIVGWLPIYHDMGLIGNVLQPLFVGAQCILLSPVAFLQKPFRWLSAISRYKGTTSGGPNFAYDLCVRKITDQQRITLDLSSWTVAFNGSEPVRADTLERFAKTFQPCGFRRRSFCACYGLAEATLMVSSKMVDTLPVIKNFKVKEIEQNKGVIAPPGDAESGRLLVSCGKAPPGQRVIIVDPESLTECGAGRIGEIWVSGDGIAQGYWKHPEETERTFRAYLADSGQGPFLRTGDLGFLQDGELFVTGRIKDMIIIRGLNHYPHDIQQTVEESHTALRKGCGAAFSVEVAGEERLVVVQEVERVKGLDLTLIKEEIYRAVSENHDLQIHALVLTRPRGVAKTSSGKIEHRTCRAAFLSGTLDTLAQWVEPVASEIETPSPPTLSPVESAGSIESWLLSSVAAELGVEASELDLSKSLAKYGMDSLKAIELNYSIETALGINLTMAKFLEQDSIAELIAEVKSALRSARHDRGAVLSRQREPVKVFPLSHGQRALWFLNQTEADLSAYNIAGAARVTTSLDIDALRRAFQTLSDRHACLRTIFGTSDAEPFQRVLDHWEVCFSQVEAKNWAESLLHDRLSEEARRQFDLEQSPPVRITLFMRSPTEHILLVVLHHIVADFWSLAIIMHEIGELYLAASTCTQTYLPALELQYADYLRCQQQMLAGEEGERCWQYWRKQLSAELPVMDLPADRPRPTAKTYRGAYYGFNLDGRVIERLQSLSEANNATVYTTLLAAFLTLLYRYSDQEEVVVGSPTAGRNRAGFKDIVGYFVNPVAIKAKLSGLHTFEDLLAQVRETVLGAFKHQDYPFALLVERLNPIRDPSRSPIFSCMFVFQKSHLKGQEGLALFATGQAGAGIDLGGLRLEPVSLKQQAAQFDLTLMITQADDRPFASLQYNTDLFDESTIARIAGHFTASLGSALIYSQSRLCDLPLLSEAERHQLLVELNATREDFGGDVSLAKLFELQAEKTPDATAIIFDEQYLTYRELNRRANQTAHYLLARNAQPEQRVGVCMERSVMMVVALLGILKAGAAYVPLDPSYPKDRLAFMMEDTGPQALLIQGHLAEDFIACNAVRIVRMDEQWHEIARQPDANTAISITGQNICYVIYTSGSTGKPKGVMNTHAGVRNRLLWMQRAYGISEADCVLQKTPYTFDVSVWEFFWPLLNGARLVIAKPGGHKDSAYLMDTIARHKVTTIHFVPSMLRSFLSEQASDACDCLERVICSGEELPFDLQERFFSRLETELSNLYGPTEAAVDVTFWNCAGATNRSVVPIGQPISNTQTYLLDSHLRPVAVGVPGQLHIGGICLARGYMNRPELTAEKFIPNPFGQDSGARLYRTGDLARFRADGNIEFLGRIDHQVKVRGFRVELAEIESLLSQHPNVAKATCLARTDVPGDTRLVAYVAAENGKAVTAQALRGFLKQRLPDYMLPSSYVLLDEFPLTPNGKLDRQALPRPDNIRSEVAAQFAAARTPLEHVLCGIWSDVLAAKQVGIHDSFFELGGHSLLALKIISEVRDTLQVKTQLHEFLRTPTVAGLAATILENSEEVTKVQRIAQVLFDMNQLSDEEVEALLDDGRALSGGGER